LQGDVPDSLRTVLADDTFAKRFDVREEVGRGGMGRVHRGIDRDSGRPVALKVLRDADVEARFTLEAEMLERMDHPAIVAYVGHGVTTTGDAYLAMAWLDGESLARRLDGGPLSIADTLAIGIRIASALAHAHDHAIVHRDLKPGNVMLVGGDTRRATLIDFGIAKDTAVSHGLTETGQLIGTPGYMAPEQAMGNTDPSAAMDLFGLGAVLYECLTGRPPFEGNQAMEVLAHLLLRDPEPPRASRPEVPVRLDALVQALLEKTPERRTATASLVESELRAIEEAMANDDATVLDTLPPWIQAPESTTAMTVAARGLQRPQPAASSSWRRAWIAGIALAVVATGVAVTAIALHGARSTDPDTEGSRGSAPPAYPEPSPALATAMHSADPCQKQGADACKKACAAGNAVACRIDGRASYIASHGDEAAQHAAIEMLAKGCTLGDAPACSLAGTWTRDKVAVGAPTYTRDAWVVLLERGCMLDAGSSCMQLAKHLLEESPTSYDRALALYERACPKQPPACAHAAELLRHHDGPGDVERARALDSDACKRGYKKACGAR